MKPISIWQDFQRIRAEAPLVHNITNYVVMNTTANALLAIGASPVMAHAIEEVAEMAGMARALVINIGTLSTPWIEAMFAAGAAARQRRIPVVVDPVGCGATLFRTSTAQKLIESIKPAVIRGNASEIRALLHAGQPTKGVDSLCTPDEVQEDACALSRSAGCVVVVSGAVDLIVEGNRVARIGNGHSMMTRVTGMGCTASAITGAFVAVNASVFDASAHAMAVMGVAGEIAAERSQGPGSLQLNFLDALYGLQESDLVQRLQAQIPE
ncbi:MAG: hydroxyethylthiazole kinase [Betaproteobacteria bacterium]|nr:hydroxyethylthiazole kinase [Betaproteobacteria bacterium]